MKTLLAIETSGRPGAVALLLPDESVKERALGAGPHGRSCALTAGGVPEDGASRSGHARTLVPEIKALVEEAGLAPGDIEAIAVSVGPGSYTGLRVGVTAAKTLSWAISCDLVAVSTLEALARDALSDLPPGTKRVVPAMDARRGQVYAAVFELADGGLERVAEDEVLAPGELARRLLPGDHVFGSAPAAYPETLAIPEGATTEDGPVTPAASTVARLGAAMLARGETAEAQSLAPNYLREWTSPSAKRMN
jgi:tRNA threonylcarbamoyladenosine biosynthesis protein TsaB